MDSDRGQKVGGTKVRGTGTICRTKVREAKEFGSTVGEINRSIVGVGPVSSIDLKTSLIFNTVDVTAWEDDSICSDTNKQYTQSCTNTVFAYFLFVDEMMKSKQV